MTTDAELLRRSRAGHKDAFAGLVDRYQNLVCAVTFGGTGDRELAADLAQETFVAAWTSLPTLLDESRFRSWLCGIARNLVGKAKRRRTPTALGPEVTATTADPAPAADETIEHGESQALLREILGEMEESYREPLVLYYWEGRSTKEVADRLGLSTSAVEQRLSRGRKKIKAEVEERVDRALQAAKPNERFSALVLAALPNVPTPVVGVRRWGRSAAVLTGLATLGLGTWLAVGHEDRPSAGVSAEASVVANQQRSEDAEALTRRTTSAAAAMTASTPSHGSRSTGGRPSGRKSGTAEVGESIQLERFPNRVVVNLRGGASVMSDERRERLRNGGALPHNVDGPITDPPTRRVEGTVTDAEGRPVAGAAVVAGSHLHRASIHGVDHEFSGQAGAMTDHEGRFSFDAPTRSVLLTAVASGRGFAEPASVAAGEGSVELELVMAGHGAVEGQLILEGEPTPGTVVLMSTVDVDQPHIESQHQTDEGGSFRADLIPPGRYRMFAQAGSLDLEDGVGDQGPRSWVDIDVRAGEVVQRDVALERGITIEFRATRPGRLAYYAFAGVDVETWEQARDLLDDPDVHSGTVFSTPDDEETFGVIEGLPRERLTVCALRPHPLFEPPTYAECKTLPKPDTADATVTVTFDPT